MIDPSEITTIRVGQLVEADFNLSDNIPHEVGTDLRRGTVEALANFIAGIIGSTDSLAFLPISVTDGQELPPTTTDQWFLAGKGTYTQTGGFPDIVCTEELNVIIGNGTNWSLGVEIPIEIDTLTLSDIVIEMLSGYVTKAESGTYTYTGTDNEITVPINATRINITTASTVGAIAYSDTDWLYEGRPLFLCNKRASVNVQITDIEEPFKINEETLPSNFEIRPNETLEFKLDLDNSQWDFVGVIRESVLSSKRFIGTGQDYTLPTGAVATLAFIDGYMQYLEDEDFPSDLNTFTQYGDDVTFKTTIETNSQILIQYFLQ